MQKIYGALAVLIAILSVIYFIWRVDALDRNFQDEMIQVGLMISRYEAKAQFIEHYLPQVRQFNRSDLTAQRILSVVYENSLWCRLEPELVLAVIQVESQFNPRACSEAGALGLMQVMPVTGVYVGSRLGIWIGSDEDIYDIENNVRIGCVFLADCINRMGEHNGLGFYYAGRYRNHYQVYNDQVNTARQDWDRLAALKMRAEPDADGE